MKKYLFVYEIFFYLISASFSLINLRKLEDIKNNETLIVTEFIRFYNNSLIIQGNFSGVYELKNETDAILYFIDLYEREQTLKCIFNSFNLSVSYEINYEILCPITNYIHSNFSISYIKLPNNNKTFDLELEKDKIINLTYNYNSIELMTFGDYSLKDETTSILKVYLIKPKYYEIKRNLFFTAKLTFNDSTSEWIYAKGEETNENFDGTLIYQITLQHENKIIENIISNNDYCLTNNESDFITHCEVIIGSKMNMKNDYKIILFYNSKLFESNIQNIKIQGNISTLIALKNSTKYFKLNYNSLNGTENNINCSLNVNKTIYKMFCTFYKEADANFQGATADISDIIESSNNFRILSEGGTMALINGNEEDLIAENIHNIIPTESFSRKLSGGAIAGIVIGSLAILVGTIAVAIFIAGNPSPHKRDMRSFNSSSNINH